ncbi:MAG: YceI family protein [Dehalococcoidia bacterium]
MTTQTGASTLAIDPVHSLVEFGLAYMGIQTFTGRFRTVDGTIQLDEAHPENSSVTASIEAKSIDVLGDRFQGHVQGEAFFDMEKYPNLSFKSTRIEKVDDKHWKINGDLTIKATTRPVVLNTEYLGQAVHPMSKKTIASFLATTEINREDYDLKWNFLMDNGAKYVGEHTRITLRIQAVKQD